MIQALVGSMFTDLQPVAVRGWVTAGGHVWEIPETDFARTIDGVPSLHTCAVSATENPLPSVIVSSQESPDQSAGDYVSFAFDGEIVTGGGYHHRSGEEWAWSAESAEVIAFNWGRAAIVILSWEGEAGENFSAARGSVEGSATCVLSPRALVDAYVEEKARDDPPDPLAWGTRPPPAPGSRSSVITVLGPSAVQSDEHPSGSFDKVVQHYRALYGQAPTSVPGIAERAIVFEGDSSRTAVAEGKSGRVTVATEWNRPL